MKKIKLNLVTPAAMKLNFCKTSLKTIMVLVRQNPTLLKFLMDTVLYYTCVIHFINLSNKVITQFPLGL